MVYAKQKILAEFARMQDESSVDVSRFRLTLRLGFSFSFTEFKRANISSFAFFCVFFLYNF